MKAWLVVGALALAACGAGSRQSTEPLPDIPEPKFDAFQPAIRAEVEEAWEAAVDDPDDPEAVAGLAMVLHAHQQNATAETCYDRARILAPDEFRWTYLLAAVQLEQGKDEPAIANLRKALVLDAAYPPAKVKLADLLLKTGSLDEAEKLYREVIEANPESPIAWYGLGRVQATRGDTEASAESHAKAVELYPNYGQAHYALALALRRQKRTDESKRHFQLGEEHKLEMPPTGDSVLTAVRSKTRSPTEFLRAGVELDKQGRFEESVAVHLEVLKIDPDQAQAHINLISLYARLGQPDKALEHYRKAMAINENLPDCHYDYGVMMFSMKKFDRAREAFERAIDINPFYAKAHFNLGVMQEMDSQLGAAAGSYRKAIENQPDYRMAHFNLGRLLVNQGKNSEAITHFKQILEPEDEDTPSYVYALAIACARERRYADALGYMRQAKEKASSYNQWQLLASINKDLAQLEELSQ